MSFQDELLALVTRSPGLDDDELAARLGVVRQQVNQTGRRLADRGIIRRTTGPRGKIVNVPRQGSASALPPTQRPPQRLSSPGDLLSEDEVKEAIRRHLEGQGFQVEVRWGHERGIDIEATRGGERIAIEAKGDAPTPQMQGNYFLNALGELVQRMQAFSAYGLAFPDNQRFRGLLDRLPTEAWRRLSLRVFLVGRSGTGTAVREVSRPT